MTDSIKFGPEWLRNTISSTTENVPYSTKTSNSQCNHNSLSNINQAFTKYPLAEFRYGREEMISLFEKTLSPPDIFVKKMFVDKLQHPLALIPTNDDDFFQNSPQIVIIKKNIYYN